MVKKMTFILIMVLLTQVPLFVSAQSPWLSDTTLCYGKKKFDSDFEIQMEYKGQYDIIVSEARMPFFMDIDGDGLPEIITSGYENYYIGDIAANTIVFIDPRSDQVIKKIKTYYYVDDFVNSFVVLKTPTDFEIIIAVADLPENPANVRRRLVCYRSDNSIKWISNSELAIEYNNISLADFNQDGIPEVYSYNQIFNASNGVLLLDGGYKRIPNATRNAIAVNLDDNPDDLELAADFSVYKIIITNLNGTSGNQIIPYIIVPDRNRPDMNVAVADMNHDGKLDIITFSGDTLYISSYIDNKYEIIAQTNVGLYPNHITIGNVSNKDQLGIIIIGYRKIIKYSLDSSNQLRMDWTYVTEQFTTEICTLFDFDNDGIHEIVYRDLKSLKIICAKNGIPKLVANYPCTSNLPVSNYPVIGDIDGTGVTKICVPCTFGTSSFSGRLTVFGAPEGQRWAPARNIWNQLYYNPLFINDDGTVPQYMHDIATYKNGKYNNFMAQESLIDEDGNYPVPAASLTGDISCIGYDADSDSYTIDFTVHNRYDASATAATGVPISFYNGSTGEKIGTFHTDQKIKADSTAGTYSYSFSAANLTYIHMVVNTDQYPLILTDTSLYLIDECDYNDNLFIAQLPKINKTHQEICEGDTYAWQGETLTHSGKYVHKQLNISDCDSVINILQLDVTQMKTSEQSRSSCDTYTWNGQTYDTTGSYTFDTQSINGCDSIVTLQLTIHNSSLQSNVLEQCDTYTWNGQTYQKSGQYTYNGLTAAGCDSTVVLNLTIYNSEIDSIQYATCEQYNWNGQTYTQSGTYTYQGQTTHGCDSILTLALTISQDIRIQEKKEACDTYTWNGQTYDTTGSYTFDTQSINGCDSIVTLQLTIHNSSLQSNVLEQCDTYTWNGQTYQKSGQYTYNGLTAAGCDSTVVLNLTIYNSEIDSIQYATCEQYNWNGQTYTQSGTYQYQGQTTHGCDSILTLALTISQDIRIQEKKEACDTYTWNGQTYDTTGSYTFDTQSINGCDSIVTLNLIIHPNHHITEQLIACEPTNYLGTTLDYSGQYLFNLQSSAGCDSMVTLDFTLATNQIEQRTTACGEYLWTEDHNTYQKSGQYNVIYTNMNGCDSTITLKLTINPTYQQSISASACGSYEWQGQKYIQSGIYPQYLKSQDNCDSTIMLQVTIYAEVEKHDTVKTDNPYYWEINGVTYNESGKYEQAFQSEHQCDSIYYLHLTIKNETDIYFPNIISTNGGANGYFTAYSTGKPVEIEVLSVYDRWGNAMYHAEHIMTNEPESGWNGTYKGKVVQQGVFTWIARVQLPDGSKATYTGDVTVLR